MIDIVGMVEKAQDALTSGKQAHVRFSGQESWVEIKQISVSRDTSGNAETQSGFVEVVTADLEHIEILIAPAHLIAVHIRDMPSP